MKKRLISSILIIFLLSLSFSYALTEDEFVLNKISTFALSDTFFSDMVDFFKGLFSLDAKGIDINLCQDLGCTSGQVVCSIEGTNECSASSEDCLYGTTLSGDYNSEGTVVESCQEPLSFCENKEDDWYCDDNNRVYCSDGNDDSSEICSNSCNDGICVECIVDSDCNNGYECTANICEELTIPCGDGVCEADEDSNSCLADCPISGNIVNGNECDNDDDCQSGYCDLSNTVSICANQPPSLCSALPISTCTTNQTCLVIRSGDECVSNDLIGSNRASCSDLEDTNECSKVPSSCRWSTVTNSCTEIGQQICGNGVKEGSESCDGTDFGSDTCQTWDYDDGNLACTSSCTRDISDCSYGISLNILEPSQSTYKEYNDLVFTFSASSIRPITNYKMILKQGAFIDSQEGMGNTSFIETMNINESILTHELSGYIDLIVNVTIDNGEQAQITKTIYLVPTKDNCEIPSDDSNQNNITAELDATCTINPIELTQLQAPKVWDDISKRAIQCKFKTDSQNQEELKKCIVLTVAQNFSAGTGSERWLVKEMCDSLSFTLSQDSNTDDIALFRECKYLPALLQRPQQELECYVTEECANTTISSVITYTNVSRFSICNYDSRDNQGYEIGIGNLSVRNIPLDKSRYRAGENITIELDNLVNLYEDNSGEGKDIDVTVEAWLYEFDDHIKVATDSVTHEIESGESEDFSLEINLPSDLDTEDNIYYIFAKAYKSDNRNDEKDVCVSREERISFVGEDDPECESNSDCNSGYECISNECTYVSSNQVDTRLPNPNDNSDDSRRRPNNQDSTNGDSDNDGLDDQWEIDYFGSLSQGANDDFDNDGNINIDEYAYGSDPTSADASNLDGASLWPWFIVLIVLIGGVGAGLYYVKKKKKLVENPIPQDTKQNLDPLAGLNSMNNIAKKSPKKITQNKVKIDKSVVDYIYNCRNLKFPDEEITQELKKSGWDEKTINNAFNHLNK